MGELCIKMLFPSLEMRSLAATLLRQVTYPWEALGEIAAFIRTIGVSLPAEYERRGDSVWVHREARVAPTAFLGEGIIVGAGAELRHGAYVRGDALIGAGAVVGNSTELKNVLLFDGVQVPHYNYVGDSILGYQAHMGAGAITSNVRADKGLVVIHGADGRVETGRKKVGAFLGDGAEVGCNAVLCPGAIVGAGAVVYPLSLVRGVVPAGSLYKRAGEIVPLRR